jgi:hypothetical protein
LAAVIRSADHSSDAHHTAQANWCESRLLMHASVCAARRVQLEFEKKDGMPQTAMGLLGDAEATLRVSEPGRHSSDIALIELYRADARLMEAESVQIQVGPPPIRFSEFCQKLAKDEQKNWTLENWKRDCAALWWSYTGRERDKSEQTDPSPVEKELRRASALVSDAIRFLNRAEPILQERRRNVWWTTWFFERKLRSIAYSVWASVFEIGAPIPYLGLEAAMRNSDTAADTLLDDTKRMIRVDAYRLATVVEAYASCALALKMRLMLDPRSIPLPHRQKTMVNKLGDALYRLRRVRDARDGRESPIPEGAEMDKDGLEYIDLVLKNCNEIKEHLEYDFYRSEM